MLREFRQHSIQPQKLFIESPHDPFEFSFVLRVWMAVELFYFSGSATFVPSLFEWTSIVCKDLLRASSCNGYYFVYKSLDFIDGIRNKFFQGDKIS